MPRKTISRVRATPRAIREIKPKRLVQRNNNLNQISEGDDDWSYQSNTANSTAAAAPLSSTLSSSGEGTRQRFHKEETAELPNDNNEPETKDHKHKTNYLHEKWEIYKHTPLRKKMRQFLWLLILYHSLKMIYMADLENMQISSDYDSPVSIKPMSKGFFTKSKDDALSSSKLSSATKSMLPDLLSDRTGGKKYDFLGRPIESGGSSVVDKFGAGLLSKSSSGKTEYDFLGNPIVSSGSSASDKLGVLGSNTISKTSAEKKYDFLGNPIDLSGSSALDKFGVSESDTLSKASSGKTFDFLGNPVESSGSSAPDKFGSPGSSLLSKTSSGKAFDFLGNPVDSKSSALEKFGVPGSSTLSETSSGNSHDFLGNPIDPRGITSLEAGSGTSNSYGSITGSRSKFFSPTNSLGASDGLSKANEPDALTKSYGGFDQTKSIIGAADSKPLQGLPIDNAGAWSVDSAKTNTLDALGSVGSDNTFGINIPPAYSGELQSNPNLRGNSFKSDKTMDVDQLSSLNCEPHGGPSSQHDSSEIIYWHDISTDASFASPFYSPKSQEQSHDGSNNFWKTKYLTFEMDGSGFNNMRLGFENVMLMAHAMGRTLVMPPRRQLAHGLRDVSGRKIVSFSDFYDISTISAEQSGLQVISMEQFLEREAMIGNLKGQYPPDNRIKWDNQPLDPLWNYIANVTEVFNWSPRECVLAFARQGSDGQDLLTMMDDILNAKDDRPFPQPSEFQGRPTRYDAPTVERLREALGGRRKLCLYDKSMHLEHDVVHFRADIKETRLITQFYAFLFFEDWRQDLWAKRFIRDHLRYRDEIMCLAARVVTALRTHARQDSFNVHGDYDAIHVRRGDFQSQYPGTNLTSSEILLEMQKTLKSRSTLFIATDEHNRTFFEDIEAFYDVKYIGDFSSEISSINPNYFSLVEQIVASRSRLFIGTYRSTFSSLIVRLRGYYSVKEKKEGYNSGALKDTYYMPAKYRNAMRMYQAVEPPFWSRDFPTAWRDIDHLELPQKQAMT